MKRLLIIAAIIITAVLLVWQLFYNKSEIATIAPTQTVEWFGENIVLTELTPEGQLKEQLFANTLTHYMPDNMTDVSEVKLILYPTKADDRLWELRSDKGRLFHGKNRQDIIRIDLWHNVMLTSPETDTQTAVTIHTSTLAIFPDKEYAHTDQYTTIEQVGQKMSGHGMEIFFETQVFHLINQVSSTHETTIP
jgi:lipopolysaccharide export system protein LptC